MRLLTYNILEGGARRAEEIAEVIKAATPDVVALQEAIDPVVVEREHAFAFHVLAGDFNALAPGEVLDASHMPR